MPYIDDELLEKMINTMAEGFARIEKKLERINRQRAETSFWTMWTWRNCLACRNGPWHVTGKKGKYLIIVWMTTGGHSTLLRKYGISLKAGRKGKL